MTSFAVKRQNALHYMWNYTLQMHFLSANNVNYPKKKMTTQVGMLVVSDTWTKKKLIGRSVLVE